MSEWKELYFEQKDLLIKQGNMIKELKQRIAFFKSTLTEAKPKKKVKRSHSLQVIDGGKKFEEKPPFTN